MSVLLLNIPDFNARENNSQEEIGRKSYLFIYFVIICNQEYINTYIQQYAKKRQDSKATLTALTAAL